MTIPELNHDQPIATRFVSRTAPNRIFGSPLIGARSQALLAVLVIGAFSPPTHASDHRPAVSVEIADGAIHVAFEANRTVVSIEMVVYADATPVAVLMPTLEEVSDGQVKTWFSGESIKGLEWVIAEVFFDEPTPTLGDGPVRWSALRFFQCDAEGCEARNHDDWAVATGRLVWVDDPIYGQVLQVVSEIEADEVEQ